MDLLVKKQKNKRHTKTKISTYIYNKQFLRCTVDRALKHRLGIIKICNNIYT